MRQFRGLMITLAIAPAAVSAVIVCITATTAIGADNGATRSAAAIPDFSGTWSLPSLNALEPPLSGPGPVRNRSRLRTGAQAGAGDGRQLVGDYTNPILKPWAAEVLKKYGEISLTGKGFPTPRNQCWTEGVPFVFINRTWPRALPRCRQSRAWRRRKPIHCGRSRWSCRLRRAERMMSSGAF